ncbi:vomeronasal type-2 receptor 26-like [Dendropsophus ebraccatus]|uniref:vomeronasal type-2 receptor 26-like n=1 Tax=Dendropsophus ebraccatus TaxID=150705 RepID=UPI0038317E61
MAAVTKGCSLHQCYRQSLHRAYLKADSMHRWPIPQDGGQLHQEQGPGICTTPEGQKPNTEGQKEVRPLPSYYRYVLALIFAIDEINKDPDILPNVTLGYHVTDSCNNVNKAIEKVLQIISGPGDVIPNYSCTDQYNLVGVIGDQSSKTSLQISNILSMYCYSQISYGATDIILTNKKIHPYFFQTLPDDRTQYLAIVKLLIYFGWTWFGVIASDDDGGHRQIQELKTITKNHDICIEFIINMRSEEAEKKPNISEMDKIIFSRSTSKIIVLCGTISFLTMSYIELKTSSGHEKTIIVPAGPNFHVLLSSIFKKTLHGSLVFSPPTKEIPHMRTFLEAVSPANRPNDLLLEHVLALFLNCSTSNPILNTIYEGSLKFKLYNCSKNPLGEFVYFNEKGEMTTNYIISTFASLNIPNSDTYVLTKFGEFNESSKDEERLVIQQPPKLWKNGSIMCQRCPDNQWPNDINQCVLKLIDVLSFKNDLTVLIVSIISALCFAKTSIILGIFILFRDTPVVRANNQTLSFILLVSIMLSFLCVFLFLGRPTHITCMLRQTSFGIIFSVAISSILAKTIMVYMAFKATKPGSSWRKFIGVKITNCVVFFCSFLQVLLSIIWVSTSPPFPEQNTQLYQDKIIFQCNEGSMLAFSILLGYMGLLAAVSFIVAFLARNLPDSFNEAKNITFSMLVVCSVWVAFIPAYMSVTGKNTVLVEIFAIISSSLGILGCIFFPKCYIILLRPELNIKISLSRQICNK